MGDQERSTTKKIREVPAVTPYDWSRFEIYFHVEAPVEAVFRCWATSKGLESFFVKGVVFKDAHGQTKAADSVASPGDQYEWEWHFDYRSQGRILEARAPSMISFTFGGAMVVEVALASRGRSTQIHLTQSGIPSNAAGMVDFHLDCRGGWIYFLTILKGVLEHGMDARDKNPATAGSLAVDYRPAE